MLIMARYNVRKKLSSIGTILDHNSVHGLPRLKFDNRQCLSVHNS